MWSLTLFTVFFIFQVYAADIQTLTDIVSNHSSVLNQFPEYTKKTLSLEKQTSDLESSVTIIEVDALNLQTDINELTNVSIAYTEKLNSFVSYETKTFKLVGMSAFLLETLEIYGVNLVILGSQNRRTNELENYVIVIKEDLKNISENTSDVFNRLESVKQNYLKVQQEIQTRLENIDTLEENQNGIKSKLNGFMNTINTRDGSNVSSLLENCEVEQRKAKTKLEDFVKLPKAHNETREKLENLISQVEKQNSAANSRVESLRSNFIAEQSEIKKQVQRIGPLANAQRETLKTLDDLLLSLERMAEEQLEQEKIVKQLSEQLQALIESS